MVAKRSRAQLSIVSPTGYAASTCGYCTAPGSGARSSTKSSRSYGIWAHRLSPYHYQQLIDQGWRRSGDYIYKPDLLRTCCAQIPIRLAVDDYKPTKGHRRALTNLLFGVRRSRPKPARWKGKWSRDRDWDVERRWQEITPSPDAASGSASSSTAWAERVAGPITHTLQVQLALASSSAEKYELFRRYQAKIHGESDSDISSEKGFSRFLVDTSLILTWPSTGEPLSSAEETEWQSKKLDAAELPDELPYGCYHQEYRLEGRLVAVAVVDILPRCVSSVYVFYDPDEAEWQLGKVTALYEVALTKRLARRAAMRAIKHYYLGFYIHGCQKMKYKAEYRPSEVLDCSTNTWISLAAVAGKLDAKQSFGWTRAHDDASSSTRDGAEDAEDAAEADWERDEVRVPTEPRPPPGMLDAKAMLKALERVVRGQSFLTQETCLDLIEEALVLDAKRQRQGIRLLLYSRFVQQHLEEAARGLDEDGCELVQAVECVAALSNAELVAQTVLFM